MFMLEGFLGFFMNFFFEEEGVMFLWGFYSLFLGLMVKLEWDIRVLDFSLWFNFYVIFYRIYDIVKGC